MIHIRSARVVDLPGVAVVLQEAFSDKMRVIFGNSPAKARALLEAVYTGPVQRGYDGVIVAEMDGRIVGTLVVEPIFHTQQENRLVENLAVRELGLPRALRAAFLLWLFSHEPEPGEAYISDVGVAPDCQGLGIGQGLMAYAEEWALEHERTRLSLWVAESNSMAIHVYEKAGYAIRRTRSSLLTRLAFGIRHWYFMERSLIDEAGTSLDTEP
jgi:ribosomal protein S18 acetylase RimI-like enzyme